MNLLHCLLLLCLLHMPLLAQESTFPHRSQYPELNYIGLTQLKNSLQRSLIIDTRSELEFNTVDIVRAINIPFSNRGFLVSVKELVEQSPSKQLVVYCNGGSCEKSYQAGRMLKQQKINTWVFDAGMVQWLATYPQDSVLLGKTPVNIRDVITEQEFETHQLHYDEFLKLSEFGYVFDIRDIYQRSVGEAQLRQRLVTLDKMLLLLAKGKFKDKPLFIFDATGRQSRWLQYHLKSHHYDDYYFLKGGFRSIKTGSEDSD